MVLVSYFGHGIFKKIDHSFGARKSGAPESKYKTIAVVPHLKCQYRSEQKKR